MRHTLTLLLSVGLAACGWMSNDTHSSGSSTPPPPAAAALPTLGIDSAEASESAAGLVLRVRLSEASSQIVTVDYASANGTATAPSDYGAIVGSLRFAPGTVVQTLTLPLQADALDESDESFTVTLANPVNATLAAATGTATIRDDDTALISISDVAASESVADAQFTVSLSTPSASTVTVDAATVNGSAQADSDYSARSGTLSFAPGTVSQIVAVPVLADTLDEPDESFRLDLANAVNATITDTSGMATIFDDDDPPGAPSLSIADASVVEGNGGTVDLVFSVSLSAASSNTVTVSFSSADGSATAPADYAAGSGSLAFVPGGALTQSVRLAVQGDAIDEPDESLSVTLRNPENATLADASATGTIADDDAPPAPLTLSIADAEASEGSSGTSQMSFAVTLSGVPQSDVTVDFASSDGSAAGSDYTARTGTLTFTPTGPLTRSISIALTPDTVDEPDESFAVTLANVSANATISDGSATGTIRDDDAPTAATPTLFIADAQLAEGNSGTGAMQFMVTLSADPARTVTVDYATANGTAIAPADYAAKTGSLSFAPGGALTQSISVSINGDTVVEDNELFALTLGNPANAALADGAAVGLITNDDTAPTCSVAAPAAGPAFCGKSSWVAGATEFCGGKLVYRDYVYDDYGADAMSSTRPIQKGPLAPAAGDTTYAPASGLNSADLVRFEMAVEGSQLLLTYELNTLTAATQANAGIAIDTDNNSGTGSAQMFGLTTSGADFAQSFKQGDAGVTVDIASNTLTARIAKPAGEAWRVWAATAQASGTVMNVAFRGVDEEEGASGDPTTQASTTQGNFWEDRQAAALADEDISNFSAQFCTADLGSTLTRGGKVGAGLHQRVYTSSYTLTTAGQVRDAAKGDAPAEGISTGGVGGVHGGSDQTPCGQYFHYLGKYQPYGFYLPASTQAAAAPTPGIQMVLHGCSANHGSQINQPGMQQKFGENLNRYLVSPLGRGPTGFFSGFSERDAMDVLADVQANYAYDTEKVHMSGYSMGGFGAMRLGALYPQLWASIVNWVGFTGDIFNTPMCPSSGPFKCTGQSGGGTQSMVGADVNIIDYLDNLRWVPMVALYSGADYLVSVNTGEALRQKLASLSNVVSDFYFHPAAEHLSYIALDDWTKEAKYSHEFETGKFRSLNRNPAKFSYRTSTFTDSASFGLKHDRAYWVSGIVAKTLAVDGETDNPAIIEIESKGCGKPAPVLTAPPQDQGTDPVPWQRTRRIKSGETPVPIENKLIATLTNVSSFTVDASGACFSSAPIAYDILTPQALVLTIDFGGGTSKTLSLPASAVRQTGTL